MAEFAPRERRWLVALAILLGVLVGHGEALSSGFGSTTYAYDTQAVAHVGTHTRAGRRRVQIGAGRRCARGVWIHPCHGSRPIYDARRLC